MERLVTDIGRVYCMYSDKKFDECKLLAKSHLSFYNELLDFCGHEEDQIFDFFKIAVMNNKEDFLKYFSSNKSYKKNEELLIKFWSNLNNDIKSNHI